MNKLKTSTFLCSEEANILSQTSTDEELQPAASAAAGQSQQPSASDTRPQSGSDTQPAPSSVAGVSPSADSPRVPANPCTDPAYFGHRGSVSEAISSLPDCSQIKNGSSGVPQNASGCGDEMKDVSRGSVPCASTEGRTDSSQEPPQPKFCALKYDVQSYRERERDRLYSDWSRDKQRHYRDRNRSPERHRYRRDYRDHHYHRSYRDRSPHRDRDSERRRERTSQHSYRDRHHERPHHLHYQRCRDDWGRDRRGHCYDYDDEAHDHWKRKEERRDSLAVKDKSNGRDRDCVASSSSPVPETAAKDSLVQHRPLASEPIANGEDHKCREKQASPESHRSKKHKKSKKKKKSKDKDRHRDSW